jgi:hypothetical protein
MHYLLGACPPPDEGRGERRRAPPARRSGSRPDTPNAHFALGQALASTKDWDGAAAASAEALRVDPKDEQSRTELAKVHNNRAARSPRWAGPADALRALEAVRAPSAPSTPSGHLNLGKRARRATSVAGRDRRVDHCRARRARRRAHAVDGGPTVARAAAGTRPLAEPAVASASPSLRAAVEGR